MTDGTSLLAFACELNNVENYTSYAGKKEITLRNPKAL